MSKPALLPRPLASLAWTTIAVLSLAFALATGCDKSKDDESSSEAPETKPSSEYPTTADGLKELMNDIGQLAVDDHVDAAAELAGGLVLAPESTWFTDHYGAELGGTLAEEYATHPSARDFALMVGAQLDMGRTETQVEGFDAPGDPNAIAWQDMALEAQVEKAKLWSWRATEPGEVTGMHIHSFVVTDDGWKLVGQMKQLKPEMEADPQMSALASLRNKDREIFFETGKLPGDP